MSLKDRLLKNSTIKNAAILKESKSYLPKDLIKTKYPIVNVALSGSIDGGLPPGITVIAGPSKHFKTGFSLVLAKAFQEAHPEGIVLFYDSERGSPPEYFDNFEIDVERVLHIPVNNLEELKFDLVRQCYDLEATDKVMVIVDSVGNLASMKELQDTLDQKSVADMTRAKEIKSLFRSVTPIIKDKDIPMIAINHTYKEMALYPKDIVSGGTGQYYSADNVWIVGRRQEKDGKDIKGYHFTINIDKSRFVKEGSKFPVTAMWDHGIYRHSGLLELALIHGSVVKPNQGWYAFSGFEDKKYREKELLENDEFWNRIFGQTNFKEWIEKRFKTETNTPPVDFEDFDESEDNSTPS
jgi:RecA/RadA recombinase